MAKSKTDETVAKPRNDAYTGMLAISFLALTGACVLLYLEYDSYAGQNPPKVPDIDVPGAKIGKISAPVRKVETPKEEQPKDDSAPKDEPKKDEPKKDDPAPKDEPKKDEPKKDEPAKDEPKKVNTLPKVAAPVIAIIPPPVRPASLDPVSPVTVSEPIRLPELPSLPKDPAPILLPVGNVETKPQPVFPMPVVAPQPLVIPQTVPMPLNELPDAPPIRIAPFSVPPK